MRGPRSRQAARILGVRTSFILKRAAGCEAGNPWVCYMLLPPAAAVGAAQPSAAEMRRPPPASVS